MASALADKIALVTGAGSGLGQSIALAYSSAGARVVVSDIDESAGARTAAQIVASGGEAHFVRADTACPSDHEALVAAALDRFGALHIACNNAGISGAKLPVGEYPLDEWDRLIRINLSGVFYGMRYQVPAMLRSGGGSIVNMASVLGSVGVAKGSAYAAAKHGVIGLTRAAALEYAALGIRINAAGPGFIETPLLNALTQEELDGLTALHPIGRLGRPSEVAELVVWLSSGLASFVTGSFYPVDGGYLAK
jgi:NAD(P)-dependent dehydrogenase (short-subunit alcohol dehydrogenase family)